MGRNRQLEILGRAAVAAAAGGAKGRRFEIVAYTGEPLVQDWWDLPVVVDLAGIDAGDGRLPILDDHLASRSAVVGQSETATVEGGQFVLRGPLFMKEAATRDICRLADQGFAWQASIGAHAMKRRLIREGETVEANGRTYDGPIYLATQTLVREVSFVVMGADKNTSVLVARRRGQGASAGGLPPSVEAMLAELPELQADLRAELQAELGRAREIQASSLNAAKCLAAQPFDATANGMSMTALAVFSEQAIAGGYTLEEFEAGLSQRFGLTRGHHGP